MDTTILLCSQIDVAICKLVDTADMHISNYTSNSPLFVKFMDKFYSYKELKCSREERSNETVGEDQRLEHYSQCPQSLGGDYKRVRKPALVMLRCAY